jgi:hypothetical protein
VIPLQRLSSTPVPAEFLEPDDIETPSSLVDYELGGVALNDPSQGLKVRNWRLRLVGNDVRINADGVPEETLFTRSGITELSLTFDQNMRPYVAFVQNGQAILRWYDTLAQQQIFLDLDPATVTPRVCLDDKRPLQVGGSDVILAYVRDDNLYFRAQRDRFEIEYLLQTAVGGKLIRVGMNQKLRLQFLLEENG